RLIIKRKLREEYSIIWVIATVTLIIFSFWTDGLTIIANFLGIRVASNLIFTGAIFLILIYLIHLSIIVSKLHENNKKLAQNLTMMKEKMEKEVIEKKN
ncbi:MAG: DUF2304 domain-containing protein, partial [Bacteroidetes bacterium]|nr:DUF2304 domain-containing protein [Bacteroidota bacterium]